MRKEDITRNTRLAFRVNRYHTWPTTHGQTVGEHTTQVMRLYVEIFGLPRSEVWLHILWHDVGEIQTGDIPYPVKRNNPTLHAEMDRLEQDARDSMGSRVYLPPLEEHERVRFKFCDLLDCAEHGQYEARLGNEYMAVIADQRNGLAAILRQMSSEDRVRATDYCMEKRILLHGVQMEKVA